MSAEIKCPGKNAKVEGITPEEEDELRNHNVRWRFDLKDDDLHILKKDSSKE